MPVGMYLRQFAANFSTSKEADQVPLAEFPRTREWLHKTEVMLTDVDEHWLVGWSTGAMSFDREDAGKRQKAVVGTMDDGEMVCAIYAREQRADEGCSFIDVVGFCNYADMDEFEKIDKETSKWGRSRSEGGWETTE